MKRCPKCNRTYASGNQKFCTQDGGLLEVVEGAQGDTIRIDSDKFKDTVEEAATRAISRELVSESAQFDPFKTVMARPEETTGAKSRNTQDLVPPASAPLPPAPTSASLPPLTQGSGSLPASDSGTLPSLPPLPGSSPASDPGSSSSADLERTLYTGAPPPQSRPLPPPQSQPLPPPQSQPLPPPQSQPLHPQQGSQPLAAPQAANKSKLPLILGLLAVLLFLGAGVVVAGYFVVLPMLSKRGEVTRTEPTPQPPTEATPRTEPSASQENPSPPNEPPPFSPPPNAVEFVNSSAKLDGKLAEHFVDFSFYYPKGWQKDPTAGVAGAKNFAKIQRLLAENFPQEIFAVGWYSSTGSEAADRASYPKLAEQRSAQFEKEYPEYRKISEGETKAGAYNAYEFRFESVSRNTDKGDIKVWGRVIFVPPIDGSKNGVTLLMLATSLAPELKRVDDVGVKGELPMLLESFRFGKK